MESDKRVKQPWRFKEGMTITLPNWQQPTIRLTKERNISKSLPSNGPRHTFRIIFEWRMKLLERLILYRSLTKCSVAIKINSDPKIICYLWNRDLYTHENELPVSRIGASLIRGPLPQDPFESTSVVALYIRILVRDEKIYSVRACSGDPRERQLLGPLIHHCRKQLGALPPESC